MASRWARLLPDAPLLPNLPAASAVVERFRNLAVQVEEKMPPEPASGTVLAVTGADSGSGKTFTSLNLALSISRGGERRVLIVEADVWQPKFHNYFEIYPEAPGLIQVLEQNLSVKDVTMSALSSRGMEIDLVAAGGRGLIGGILGVSKLEQSLEQMRSLYEVIVIDSPPHSLATGRVLASIADRLLIVVRAGQTRRSALEEVLGGLEPSKLVGFVLNYTRNSKEPYSHYYGNYAGSR